MGWDMPGAGSNKTICSSGPGGDPGPLPSHFKIGFDLFFKFYVFLTLSNGYISETKRRTASKIRFNRQYHTLTHEDIEAMP